MNIYKNLKYDEKMELIKRIITLDSLKKYIDKIDNINIEIDIMTDYRGQLGTNNFNVYDMNLNLYYLENMASIIKTISHELAHVIFFEHSKNHSKLTNLINKLIKIHIIG